jgi:hypothetical protein
MTDKEALAMIAARAEISELEKATEHINGIAQEIGSLPWYVQERALETLRGKERDVRFQSLSDLPPSQKEILIGLLQESYESAMHWEGDYEREEEPYAGHLDAPEVASPVEGRERKDYAAGREERMRDMAATTSKIISVDRVQICEGQPGFERNSIYNPRNDETLEAAYDAQKLRIERLESWVAEAISKPSMPRELRLEGLELVGAERPDVRQSVERICPSKSQGLERSLEIER